MTQLRQPFCYGHSRTAEYSNLAGVIFWASLVHLNHQLFLLFHLLFDKINQTLNRVS